MLAPSTTLWASNAISPMGQIKLVAHSRGQVAAFIVAAKAFKTTVYYSNLDAAPIVARLMPQEVTPCLDKP